MPNKMPVQTTQPPNDTASTMAISTITAVVCEPEFCGASAGGMGASGAGSRPQLPSNG